MADPRELLARLNPTNVRFDVGQGGGVPELTNIDIAGALGMVPAGLGREVLEACWWPDGAVLRWSKFHALITSLVIAELERQHRMIEAAERDVMMVESQIHWSNQLLKRGATSAQIDELVRAEDKAECARRAGWPKNTIARVPAIATAIIEEIRTRRGSQEIVEVSPVDRRRAIAMKVDPSDYPKRWKVVYEWLFDRMYQAEEEAGQYLARALRRAAA